MKGLLKTPPKGPQYSYFYSVYKLQSQSGIRILMDCMIMMQEMQHIIVKQAILQQVVNYIETTLKTKQ